MQEEHDVRNNQKEEDGQESSKFNRTCELPKSAIQSRLDNAQILVADLKKLELNEKIQKRIDYWDLAIRYYKSLLEA